MVREKLNGAERERLAELGLTEEETESCEVLIFQAGEYICREGAALDRLLRERPGVTILCREVGCGVSPMDEGDRIWRERVGRVCCELAKRAGHVVRLCCGLPMVLKGEAEWN